MKKIFLSFILVVGISVTISASPSKREGGKGRAFRMTKELSLTSDQQQKLEAIGKDFRVQFNDLKENSTLSKEEKRAKMKDLSKSRKKQTLAILTPEQQTKWNDLRSDRKENPRHGRKNTVTKESGIDRQLGLTLDQKGKMKSLNNDFKTQMQQLKENKALTKEDKAKQRQEIVASYRSSVQSLLTPEQQTKWKAENKRDMKKYRHEGNAGKRNKGHRTHWDADTKAKLDALGEDFQKQKEAIKLSRIAPEMQDTKIGILREKYRTDRREIIQEARKKKETNSPI